MLAAVTNLTEYTVTELAFALKRTVEDAYGLLRVRGELSGFKKAASGHLYFTLKDEKACIDAVAWRGSGARLAFEAADGLEVICTGRLTTYPGRSKYQIVVERIEPAGVGALMALLEERRRLFAAEGLFDAERKKPLPYLPETVGVVTSPTGAVIRDIIHRIKDRFPVHVVVWPIRVQGETAGPEAAAAVTGFNMLKPGGPIPRPDVLIVARGGGSIEDLMAFNEEAVVRAAAASKIPLISAVGHETDTTLIDFASDMRAPTPTAAAELVAEPRTVWLGALDLLADRMADAVNRVTDTENQRLDSLAGYLGRPSQRVAQQHLRLAATAQRHAYAVRSMLTSCRHQLQAQEAHLAPATLRWVERASQRLRRTETSLRAMDPRLVLGRGYAWLNDASGSAITSVTQLQHGQQVRATLADGEVDLSVSARTPG